MKNHYGKRLMERVEAVIETLPEPFNSAKIVDMLGDGFNHSHICYYLAMLAHRRRICRVPRPVGGDGRGFYWRRTAKWKRTREEKLSPFEQRWREFRAGIDARLPDLLPSAIERYEPA